MKPKTATFRPLEPALYGLLAACGTILFVPGPGSVLAQQAGEAAIHHR